MQDSTNLNKRNLWQQNEIQAVHINKLAHRRMWFYQANFEQDILFGPFQLHISFHLTVKYKAGKLIAIKKLFSNLKLQKNCWILRQRIWINDQIFNIVLLFLTLPQLFFSFLLLLLGPVLLEIIVSPNKSCVITILVFFLFFYSSSFLGALFSSSFLVYQGGMWPRSGSFSFMIFEPVHFKVKSISIPSSVNM